MSDLKIGISEWSEHYKNGFEDAIVNESIIASFNGEMVKISPLNDDGKRIIENITDFKKSAKDNQKNNKEQKEIKDASKKQLIEKVIGVLGISENEFKDLFGLS